MARNGVTTASYTYDLNGNRATKTTSGGVATAVVDDQDRLTSYAGATYAYTSNGELTRKIVGTDTTLYTYDALGNLTDVELPDGTAIGYLIDAQNRRIGKTVNDTLVRAWLYQGQLTPVAELDGQGNVVSRFVYATGVNVPDYLVRDDSTYRLIRDHLGSVRLVVNVASGTVAQRLAYDEFGIETENTNPGWQPFGYAGGLTDAQTRLVRFGARDYDPVSGRWTAKDPIGFAGGATGLYSYVGDDPITYSDPTGRCAEPVSCAIVVAASGGLVASNGAVVAATTVAIGATVSAIGIANTANSAVYSVYRSISAGADYVGMSNNPSRRAQEHRRGPHHIEIAPIISGLTKLQARAVERVLINALGFSSNGGTLLNKINSIASSNEYYQDLMDLGKRILCEIGYVPEARPAL